MTAVAAAAGLIGKADMIIRQAADTGNDPACRNLLFAGQFEYLFFEVLSRLQPECIGFGFVHGVRVLAG